MLSDEITLQSQGAHCTCSTSLGAEGGSGVCSSQPKKTKKKQRKRTVSIIKSQTE